MKGGRKTEPNGTYIDQQTGHSSASSRYLEPFYTGKMQNDTDWPTGKDVE
jgi:hypothetical protein